MYLEHSKGTLDAVRIRDSWLIERKPLQVDAQAMIEWRRYEIDNHVPNGCAYVVPLALGDSSWLVSDAGDIYGAVNLNKFQARSSMP